jgi:ABC-type proline/glycine betaine transport system permease subunit
MLFAVAVGIPLGFVAARRRGSWIDNLSTAGSLIGIAIPVFVLAYLLKYVFAVELGWLPSSGRQTATIFTEHPTGFYVLDGLITGDLEAARDALEHLILPAIALGTIPLAFITRITRASVLEVSNEDYVRTAEAKGMTKPVVMRRHILRNAMLPIITVIGLLTGLLLSGAVLTETVFAFGGIGSFMAAAVFTRDFPVIQGGILFLAVVFVTRECEPDDPQRGRGGRDRHRAPGGGAGRSGPRRVPPAAAQPDRDRRRRPGVAVRAGGGLRAAAGAVRPGVPAARSHPPRRLPRTEQRVQARPGRARP